MTSPQSAGQIDTPDNTELQAAKKVVQSFVSAFRVSTLYPAEHASSRKNVAKLQEDIEAFLQNYPTLRLDTSRNTFFYKGTALYQGPAEENNPAYLLTRDGLEYLEFVRGLTLAETSALLNLLNRNRNPFEEPEGDIVTSLWQETFSHINYQDMDIFTLESFQFDLATFKMTPAAAAGTAQAQPSGFAPSQSGQEANTEPASSPADSQTSSSAQEAPTGLIPALGVALVTVTPEESAALASQVQEQERKDFTNDILDVLLIILVVQKNKTHFVHALEFLEFQFFETLDKGDFHLTFKLLNNIQLIRNQFKEQKTWIPSLLDNFILALSSEEKFAQVSWVKNEKALRQHTPYLAQLWQVLRLLKPEIIMTLGPLAARIPMDNLHVRNELLGVLESKAKQKPEILESLLAKSDEQVNLLLVPLVACLVHVDAARIYLQMTRHGSAEIRKIGLDSYMQVAAKPDFTGLFHLLGDPDPRVRERIVSYLLQAGPETAGSLLIRFLAQTKKNYVEDHKQVLEMYRALAACRASSVLPFLETTLLESKLTGMFNNNSTMHIKGAALALRSIGSDEAMAILKKGGQSMRPDVRLVCQHVLKR
ncbi:MAG TPA: hypothetical protein DDY20_12600 [Desulfobulbaceae bacterium]|nr:hypothetical protein [Desulfobulbaceae bacterium]